MKYFVLLLCITQSFENFAMLSLNSYNQIGSRSFSLISLIKKSKPPTVASDFISNITRNLGMYTVKGVDIFGAFCVERLFRNTSKKTSEYQSALQQKLTDYRDRDLITEQQLHKCISILHEDVVDFNNSTKTGIVISIFGPLFLNKANVFPVSLGTSASLMIACNQLYTWNKDVKTINNWLNNRESDLDKAIAKHSPQFNFSWKP